MSVTWSYRLQRTNRTFYGGVKFRDELRSVKVIMDRGQWIAMGRPDYFFMITQPAPEGYKP